MAPSRVERRAIEVSGWWQELGSRLGTGTVDGRDKPPEHRRRLPAERAHHIDELDDAQAALAELVLGNERLMGTSKNSTGAGRANQILVFPDD